MNIIKAAVHAIICISMSTMAACASGPDDQGPGDKLATSASQPATLEYTLDSGDSVKITVFDEPTLSGTFVIDGQGVISMSMIGEVSAKNLTVRDLQRAVEAKLKNGYVRNPQVSAEVTNYRPFYILGEVNRPGEYPYVSGITVMNAIASAGDFTYRADKKRIVIKSTDNPNEREVTLTPSTLVRPGDTIRIRERFF